MPRPAFVPPHLRRPRREGGVGRVASPRRAPFCTFRTPGPARPASSCQCAPASGRDRGGGERSGFKTLCFNRVGQGVSLPSFLPCNTPYSHWAWRGHRPLLHMTTPQSRTPRFHKRGPWLPWQRRFAYSGHGSVVCMRRKKGCVSRGMAAADRGRRPAGFVRQKGRGETRPNASHSCTTSLTSMGAAWATTVRGRAWGGAMEDGGRAATGRLGGGMRLLLVALGRRRMAAFLAVLPAVAVPLSPAAAGRSPKRSFIRLVACG